MSLRPRARKRRRSPRAEIDRLTDVLNRRGFEHELRRSLAYVKRYGTSAALIYLDLDAFKLINDRHGHAAGDAVLKALEAAICRTTATHAGATLVIAASAGATMLLPLDQPGELLDRADRAMYARKRAQPASAATE